MEGHKEAEINEPFLNFIIEIVALKIPPASLPQREKGGFSFFCLNYCLKNI